MESRTVYIARTRRSPAPARTDDHAGRLRPVQRPGHQAAAGMDRPLIPLEDRQRPEGLQGQAPQRSGQPAHPGARPPRALRGPRIRARARSRVRAAASPPRPPLTERPMTPPRSPCLPTSRRRACGWTRAGRQRPPICSTDSRSRRRTPVTASTMWCSIARRWSAPPADPSLPTWPVWRARRDHRWIHRVAGPSRGAQLVRPAEDARTSTRSTRCCRRSAAADPQVDDEPGQKTASTYRRSEWPARPPDPPSSRRADTRTAGSACQGLCG